MITGKELEEIAKDNCRLIDEVSYTKVYDWEDMAFMINSKQANELNQRTCETCTNDMSCCSLMGMNNKDETITFLDVRFCSLYTKEG